MSLDVNHLYGYAMSKFLPTSGIEWIDSKEFELNKFTGNSSKRCILEVDLEYPKELRELHNDYPLAPDKIEIKREMLSNSQLRIADLYNIPTGNVKKLALNFFDKEKFMLHHENLQLYLRLGLKLKNLHSELEFNQSQWLKPYFEFNTQKKNRSRKNGDKDGKALYKQMNNALYGKAMKNLRNIHQNQAICHRKNLTII